MNLSKLKVPTHEKEANRVMISKNIINNPILYPPKKLKEHSFKHKGEDVCLIGYAIPKIDGDNINHITGYQKMNLSKPLDTFDGYLLFKFTAILQYRINSIRKNSPEIIERKRYRNINALHFKSFYEILKLLGLPITTQYKNRVREALFKISNLSIVWNDSYYDYKTGKKRTGYDMINITSRLRIDDNNKITLIFTSDWIDLHRGYAIEIYMRDLVHPRNSEKKFFKIKEVVFNLYAYLLAWNNILIKYESFISRRLKQFCILIGIGDETSDTKNLKFRLKKTLEEVNTIYNEHYLIDFNDNTIIFTISLNG